MRRVVCAVTVKSSSGSSIYADFSALRAQNVDQYLPSAARLERAVQEMERVGFELESRSDAAFCVSAEPALFEETFGVRLELVNVPFIGEFPRKVFRTKGTMSNPFGSLVERVSVARQSFELVEACRAMPPEVSYEHYDVPRDIVAAGRLEALRSRGHIGSGARVAMVDTGLFAHPYFRAQGLSFEVIPGVSGLDTTRDERGHGTGMASILLAAAPGVQLTMYKAASDFYSAPLPAFQKAAGSSADIINCSWGTIGFEPVLILEAVLAVRSGKLVVFSVGNGTTDNPQGLLQTIAHPEILSVGGAIRHRDGSVELSDVSSSYESALFSGRYCPDLCGPCGKAPFAQLVVMPTEPGCIYDRNNGRRDGTEVDDGWFASSGTSAAAAYVSGLAATLLAARPDIQRNTVIEVLASCCENVVRGKSYMGWEATPHPHDLATGAGFLTGARLLSKIERS